MSCCYRLVFLCWFPLASFSTSITEATAVTQPSPWDERCLEVKSDEATGPRFLSLFTAVRALVGAAQPVAAVQLVGFPWGSNPAPHNVPPRIIRYWSNLPTLIGSVRPQTCWLMLADSNRERGQWFAWLLRQNKNHRCNANVTSMLLAPKSL